MSFTTANYRNTNWFISLFFIGFLLPLPRPPAHSLLPLSQWGWQWRHSPVAHAPWTPSHCRRAFPMLRRRERALRPPLRWPSWRSSPIQRENKPRERLTPSACLPLSTSDPFSLRCLDRRYFVNNGYYSSYTAVLEEEILSCLLDLPLSPSWP